MRNFVFVVDPHNIWLISAATAHLFVTSVDCKKKGHIAKVCLKKKKEGTCHTTHLVTATPTQEVNTTEGDGDTPDHFTVYMRSVKSSDSPTPTPPLYKRSVTVDSKEIPMEIDTGSAVTLLSATDLLLLIIILRAPEESWVNCDHVLSLCWLVERGRRPTKRGKEKELYEASSS